jgi:hypothetical protein
MFSRLSYLTIFASSVSAIMYPNIRKQSAYIIVGIIGNEIINQIYHWHKERYPHQTILNDFIGITKTFGCLLSLGYITTTLPILAENNKRIGKIYDSLNLIYRLYSSSLQISLWIGCIGTTTLFIMYPFVSTMINRILSNIHRELAQFENFPNQLQNLNIEYNGITIYTKSFGILTPEQIEFIAPAECAGIKNKNNKKDFSQPDECSVCMEKYDEKYLTRTLPCGHSFHTTCIDVWLIRSSSSCPICRYNCQNNLKIK